MSRTITSLLRYSKGNKGNVIPRNILQQMEKLLNSADRKVYHHEILNLYQHLCINRDEGAFRVIDALVFPARNEQPLVEPTLALAYRRLYCLAKYQAPYGTWIGKVRQLLHQTKLNATDFRYLLTLGSFQSFRLDNNFVQLFEDIITLFEQELHKFDLLTAVALRKHFTKCIIYNTKYQGVRDKINGSIQANINMFINSQIKFLLHCKDFHEEWIFLYFLRCRDSSFKKYGFFFSFLLQQNAWKNWAVEKFTRGEILKKMPIATHQSLPGGIVQKVFSYISIKRPYIDQFFEFEQVKQGEVTKIRLKNPQKDYINFLLNAYYYFDSGVNKQDNYQFQKIDQVLKDITYLKKNIAYIFAYIAIRLSIIYYSDVSNEIKAQKQIQIIKQASELLDRKLNFYYFGGDNYRLLPTKCYRNVGMLEFQVYKTPEFKKFMDKFIYISNEIYVNVVTTRYPTQFKEIQNILKEYMSQQRPIQNKLFFGEIKKVPFSNPNIEISLAKHIEINRKATVDYLLKIKQKDSEKQGKILIDFKKFKNDNQNWKSHWKQQYLVQWCKLTYVQIDQVPIEEYIQSQPFKKKVESLIL